MRFPIPCDKQRFRLKLGLYLNEPTSLILVGSDSDRPNTVYVSRRVNFTAEDCAGGDAYKEVTIPFPLAPENMLFEIWDENYPEQRTFELLTLEVEMMEPMEIWEHPDIHSFIPFASWFAQKSGFIKTGIYDSPDHRFLIEYMPVIKDDFGQPLITPARTSRANGRIQVSQSHFLPLSVPIRWFILMHERKHFQLPTRIEKVADLTALRVFLDFGFPKVEAIYACTMAMNADNIPALKAKTQRLKDIHAFVDEYIRQKANPKKQAA